MTAAPIAIVGGGPIGMILALLLAHRHVPSIVFDARTLDAAQRDRRLLALSRGTLDTLAPLVVLPRSELAAIQTVIVSSRGEFGRAVLDQAELDARPLGATVRYGALLAALDAACVKQPTIRIDRPATVASLRQTADHVDVRLADGSQLTTPLAINAEGASRRSGASAARDVALISDIEIDGTASGSAFERFTRDGPLALLPLPATATSPSRPMALVWCMPSAVADRREALSDVAFIAEVQSAFGQRDGRIRSIHARGRYPLIETSRDALREHRIVHVGNAAQSLHPVAGQGLNLGVRDAVALADAIAAAHAKGDDPVSQLTQYEQSRRADRRVIGALTHLLPDFFATRFAPLAVARSLGLTLLGAVPNLRTEFARLLMFGVRF